MKRILVILGALVALGLPAAAQSQYPDRDYDRNYAGQSRAMMSPDDQREFNKEYEKC